MFTDISLIHIYRCKLKNSCCCDFCNRRAESLIFIES